MEYPDKKPDGQRQQQKSEKLPAKARRHHSGLPVVLVAKKKENIPLFDSQYFFTAIKRMLAAVAALGLMVYMVIQLAGNLSPTVTTTAAIRTEESLYESAAAYILRNERVLTSAVSGAMVYPLPDGARAASDEITAYIYPSDDADKNLRIAEIDTEIALLRSALQKSASAENVHDVSASLTNEYSALMALAASHDYGTAASDASALRKLLIRYDAYRGKNNDIDTVISKLNAEKTSLEAMRGNVTGTVKAPYSGYYFRYCDGYEQIFTAELADNFTSDGFYSALASTPVIPTNVAGKIVDGSVWYIIVPMTDRDNGHYTTGNVYNIFFSDNDGVTIPMTLEKKIADEKNGGTLLLFSTNRMPDGFSYIRTQNIRIEREILSGYRVPMSAVRSYRGMTGVYTLHGGRVYFRRINILSQNDDYCMVSEYSAVGNDRQPTYKVLGFNANGLMGEYESLHRYAKSKGWERRFYDNGGTPVKYGTKEDYYYFLDEFEDIILTGRKLYDGKALS